MDAEEGQVIGGLRGLVKMGLGMRDESLNVDRVQLTLLEVGGDTPPRRVQVDRWAQYPAITCLSSGARCASLATMRFADRDILRRLRDAAAKPTGRLAPARHRDKTANAPALDVSNQIETESSGH